MRRGLFLGFLLATLVVTPAAHAQTDASTPASATPAPALIEPRNALEHAFINALNNEELRPVFRRQFLTSYVALAIAARDPQSAPRMIEVRPGVRTALIFTSGARAQEVMGQQAPVLMITGRQALQRLRGQNAVININLAPALALEAEDIDAMLAMPDESVTAPPNLPTPPRLAGPTQ